MLGFLFLLLLCVIEWAGASIALNNKSNSELENFRDFYEV
jgi:hypothetical protein